MGSGGSVPLSDDKVGDCWLAGSTSGRPPCECCFSSLYYLRSSTPPLLRLTSIAGVLPPPPTITQLYPCAAYIFVSAAFVFKLPAALLSNKAVLPSNYWTKTNTAECRLARYSYRVFGYWSACLSAINEMVQNADGRQTYCGTQRPNHWEPNCWTYDLDL